VNRGYLFVDTPSREGGPPPAWGVDGRMLPPSDAAGDGVFACCAMCAAMPSTERCSGCPRGGWRLPGPFGPSEPEPRRRWWRRKDEK